MTRATTTMLGLTRRILKGLQALNAVLGLGILVLLIASVAAPEKIFSALSDEGTIAPPMRIAMQLLMVIGLLGVPLTNLVFGRLVAMVDTVRDGDPFVAANAVRLRTIAWAWLGLEVLHMVVGVIAEGTSGKNSPLDLNWNFSLTGWLAVVLLFVLAQVFAQGARMREELEGTV